MGQLRALLDAQRYRELETAARGLIERRPEVGVLWQLLGIALAKQGHDALHALAAAAECLPEDAVAQLNLGNALGRAGGSRKRCRVTAVRWRWTRNLPRRTIIQAT